MPIDVEIHLEEGCREVATAPFRKVVRQIAADYGWEDGNLSIAIVSDSRIHEINREFLKHDYPTDVISFDLTESNHFLEGEIIASVDTADREAPHHGWSGDAELLLYVVHGTLHVIGLRDKTKPDIAEMRAAEKYYMDWLNMAPHSTPAIEKPTKPDSKKKPSRGEATARSTKPKSRVQGKSSK